MSIIDRREIEFSSEGVIEVIASAMGAAQSIGLPGLQPSTVRFDPERGTVQLVYGTGQASRMLAVPGESLGALLISFCVRSHVPMPRFAEKSVRVEPNGVVLAFRMKAEPAKAEAAARLLAPKAAPMRREIGWAG